MFRFKLLRTFSPTSFSRSYLSQNFNASINKSLEICKIKKQPAANDMNFAAYLNNMCGVSRDIDVYEKLQRIRSSNKATEIRNPANFAVQFFLETGRLEDFLYILEMRLHYGVFPDDCLACYLMDHSLKDSNFNAAFNIALQSASQSELNNDLIVMFSITSCYEYLKNAQLDFSEEQSEPQTEPDKVKVRIKFLNNSAEEAKKVNILHSAGSTLLKLAEKSPQHIKINISAIGHLLCHQDKEFSTILKSNADILYKDVLTLCHNIIESRKVDNPLTDEIKVLSEKCAQTISFSNVLDTILKETAAKEEKPLIEEFQKLHKKWIDECKESLRQELESQKKSQNIAEIQNALNKFQTIKEKITFFSREEIIGLQILSKTQIYRKKWFGKKKIKKTIDKNYIPPNITNINVMQK